jgi:hypothetical protein
MAPFSLDLSTIRAKVNGAGKHRSSGGEPVSSKLRGIAPAGVIPRGPSVSLALARSRRAGAQRIYRSLLEVLSSRDKALLKPSGQQNCILSVPEALSSDPSSIEMRGPHVTKNQ